MVSWITSPGLTPYDFACQEMEARAAAIARGDKTRAGRIDVEGPRILGPQSVLYNRGGGGRDKLGGVGREDDEVQLLGLYPRPFQAKLGGLLG